MEASIKEEKETAVREEKRGMRKWLSRFLKFLAYGGWILLLIFILAIVILISVLSK